MKRYAMGALGALNLALAVGLAAAWLNPDGSLRNVHWSQPEPVTVDYLASMPLLPARASTDMGRVISMTDRPLFSPTRRPPPPPPPTVAPEDVPVDNLSTAKILGVYEGSGLGGIVVSIAGKNRHFRLNESVDGWTLKSIQGKAVVFERGGQTRTLQLTKALFKGGVVSATPLPAEFLPTPPTPVAPAVPESGARAPSPNSNPAAPSPSGARRFGP
ncbi:MAG: hypothetical protein O9331_11335 [Acidovorax sp.]|nr:hypothetical protein [Acidovorax sp.]